ncbi:hypothetical protein LX32DRAFT_304208 [Colletotrichum zoysiae]|uniref:Uncharacterized protein n=1 Tax=Colletotrichum zoysiae TaxID=1216348 RepID=A0AAD9H369_9PEZI|nr:hypothetical protein LX32DRAFT_304208 [Colletotrichum zoysiae]
MLYLSLQTLVLESLSELCLLSSDEAWEPAIDVLPTARSVPPRFFPRASRMFVPCTLVNDYVERGEQRGPLMSPGLRNRPIPEKVVNKLYASDRKTVTGSLLYRGRWGRGGLLPVSAPSALSRHEHRAVSGPRMGSVGFPRSPGQLLSAQAGCVFP